MKGGVAGVKAEGKRYTMHCHNLGVPAPTRGKAIFSNTHSSQCFQKPGKTDRHLEPGIHFAAGERKTIGPFVYERDVSRKEGRGSVPAEAGPLAPTLNLPPYRAEDRPGAVPEQIRSGQLGRSLDEAVCSRL